MVAARLNLESTELSVFANGWTIFFGAYLVTTSAESVFPSASLKMNRDLPDSTSWPWAAVAKSKPPAEIAIKQGARGLVFGIKCAFYRAGSLPPQPVFSKKPKFFAGQNRDLFEVQARRRRRTLSCAGAFGRLVSAPLQPACYPPNDARSEERRVGKECRSRWSQNH